MVAGIPNGSREAADARDKNDRQPIESSMPFTFHAMSIDGPVVVEPRVFSDTRGVFFETYKASEFAAAGIVEPLVQSNASVSRAGVLRGLHYQLPPHAQAKLVRCVSGAIFDVAVDIRRGSPTFGRWVGRELSEENRLMLYLPAGFAHGFLTLSPQAEVNYQVSAEYHPSSERGIRYDDPSIGIEWPGDTALLSDKDTTYPALEAAEVFD